MAMEAQRERELKEADIDEELDAFVSIDQLQQHGINAAVNLTMVVISLT
jgi:hypothetical protein